jgi:LAO/AO transport system kinase
MSAVESLLNGNRLALARTLTQIENNTPEGRRVLDELFLHTGQAHLVGVTGAPGTGKSSLVNQLARFYRNPPDGSKSRRVAIVAVDPSSPFTGGAILGDRVRMRDLSGDPGVFIRSMASRGSLGGLAVATSRVVQALDAAGFDLVMIETVGAGQAEVDIARLAHTTLVIEAPGLGDDIQAIKAGILEIADILVINKADRPGVENTERALKSMLQLAHPVEHVFQNQAAHHQLYPEQKPAVSVAVGEERFWEIPLIRTVATTGEGVDELGLLIDQHRAFLKSGGGWSQREKYRLKSELDSLLQATLASRWRNSLPKERYFSTLEQVVRRQVSPWQAVKSLLDGGEA